MSEIQYCKDFFYFIILIKNKVTCNLQTTVFYL